MRLSLCLIVRDEVDLLPACLESARPHVDEIVVVDTGSRDGTLDVARAAGARVVELAWTDDFAAARNASLAAASGDHALVIDADERVADTSARAKFEAYVARRADGVGRVVIENRPGGSRTEVSRLLPLDGRHRFEGRVHEQVVRTDGEPHRGSTGVTFVHLGYDPTVVAARGKVRRNVELLRRELLERPYDGYLWYQLGRTLRGDGARTPKRAKPWSDR
ncbi:MAG: glycosyltransferase [Planctomycetota bacterium]